MEKSITLTARQIIDRIITYLENEIDTDDLGPLTGELFGGVCEYDQEGDAGRLEKTEIDWFETCYRFTPNAYYRGAFDNNKE